MRRAVLVVVVVLAVLWLGSLAAVVRASRRDAATRADAIVVLGAAQYDGRPSPVLRARLDHAAALFRRGLAPLVIVTGGVGTGDTVSEAVVGRRYLLGAGLPARAVEAESAGRTSAASVRAAARRVRERGGSRAIFVSDGFHLLRLGFLARRLGLQPFGSPAPESPITSNSRLELGYFLAESVKAPVALLLGR
jgi:uncharacterized SAM-binding protein YcdF (DUF218 family)